MKKLMLLGFVLVNLHGFAQDKKQVLDVANDGNKPQFKFDVEEYNFGTVKAGEVVSYEFVFTNVGNEPIIITEAHGSCGCTVPIYPKEPIVKNQKSKIKVTFNSAGKMGMQDKTVTITSNALQSPLILHIKGTVESAPVQNPNPSAK
jgi:hypothetical protein